MYLKEAIIVGFIALGIILFNFGIKFYYIFKRGYRISNLIIIKLVIRTICISSFIGVLILGFSPKDKFSSHSQFDSIYIGLSVQIDRGKLELDQISRQKIEEFIKLNSTKKIGLVIYKANPKMYYLVIPPTTSAAFGNLIQSKNLILDANVLAEIPQSELQKMKLINLSISDSTLINSSENERSHLDYLNNLSDIPFIKVYLLILLLILLSSELFLKLKIIKI
jgi:hypothetical protein